MKLIIDIPEEDREDICNIHFVREDLKFKIGKAIQNGTPLDDIKAENKGEWIVREDNTSFVKQIPRRWVECSHCGWSFSYDRIHDDFCSKCGADMRGDKDEDR